MGNTLNEPARTVRLHLPVTVPAGWQDGHITEAVNEALDNPRFPEGDEGWPDGWIIGTAVLADTADMAAAYDLAGSVVNLADLPEGTRIDLGQPYPIRLADQTPAQISGLAGRLAAALEDADLNRPAGSLAECSECRAPLVLGGDGTWRGEDDGTDLCPADDRIRTHIPQPRADHNEPDPVVNEVPDDRILLATNPAGRIMVHCHDDGANRVFIPTGGAPFTGFGGGDGTVTTLADLNAWATTHANTTHMAAPPAAPLFRHGPAGQLWQDGTDPSNLAYRAVHPVGLDTVTVTAYCHRCDSAPRDRYTATGTLDACRATIRRRHDPHNAMYHPDLAPRTDEDAGLWERGTDPDDLAYKSYTATATPGVVTIGAICVPCGHPYQHTGQESAAKHAIRRDHATHRAITHRTIGATVRPSQ